MNPHYKMSIILSGLGLMNGYLYLNHGMDLVNLIAQTVCVGTAVYFFYLGLTDMYESDKLNKKDE